MATAIVQGADLVIASGDKLLGGPQAGLVVGTDDLIQRCRRHPLARPLRIDKLRLAALEATLRIYQRDRLDDLPTWAMLHATIDDLRTRARPVHHAAVSAGTNAQVVDVGAVVGGGSMPGTTIPSVAVAIVGPPRVFRTRRLVCCASTRPAQDRSTRRKPRQAYDIRVPNADDEYCTKARCTGKCHRRHAGETGSRSG